MPDPHIYPEGPIGPLSLPAAAAGQAPDFTEIEQLAAPDLSTPNIPRSMFIRVAMSGPACPGVNSATAPNFYVRADSGDAVLINDHALPPNLTYPIFNKPGSNPADFVGEGSVFLEDHNVFRLIVTFNDATSDHVWQLGIANNDIAAARQFTFVVSGKLASTAQPWINVAPANLSWDSLAGDSEVRSVTVSNRGTGPFSVIGVTPVLPPGFEVALPGVIHPNASAALAVTFNAPTMPPPGGTVTGATDVELAPPDSSASQAEGHNSRFSFTARTTANVWKAKAPMPTPRNSLALVAAGNGKLYALGGSGLPAGTFHPVATLEEYDPATDMWTTKSPMPTPRSDLGFALASNGKLYAIGGIGRGIVFFATVEEYDPATDTWTTKTPMPTARCSLGLAAANNGRLYAVGGMNASSDAIAAVEEYDPMTDSWTTRAAIPTGRPDLALSAAANGKLYAVGGTHWTNGDDDDDGSHSHPMATVDEYDPETDGWASKLPMPTARGALGLACARNGKLYAIGGWDNPVPFTAVEAYDPSNNSWTTRAPMPSGRHAFGLACAGNGRLYAVGGAGGVLGIVEEYTT